MCDSHRRSTLPCSSVPKFPVLILVNIVLQYPVLLNIKQVCDPRAIALTLLVVVLNHSSRRGRTEVGLGFPRGLWNVQVIVGTNQETTSAAPVALVTADTDLDLDCSDALHERADPL